MMDARELYPLMDEVEVCCIGTNAQSFAHLMYERIGPSPSNDTKDLYSCVTVLELASGKPKFIYRRTDIV